MTATVSGGEESNRIQSQRDNVKVEGQIIKGLLCH